MITINDYVELSKKSGRAILILVDKDLVCHCEIVKSELEKEDVRKFIVSTLLEATAKKRKELNRESE